MNVLVEGFRSALVALWLASATWTVLLEVSMNP